MTAFDAGLLLIVMTAFDAGLLLIVTGLTLWIVNASDARSRRQDAAIRELRRQVDRLLAMMEARQ